MSASSCPGATDAHRELLRRIAMGDEMAMAEFYAAFRQRVFVQANRYVLDWSCAEEVTQDVFRQAWSQAGDYDPARCPISSWLLMITRSRALDLVRRRRRLAAESGEAIADRDFVSADESPEQAYVRRVRDGRVKQLVSELQPAQRAAVEMAFYDGYSHQEIAAKTGLPLGTIKTRIRGALGRMRQGLDRDMLAA